jgi:hypothetical protein
MRCALLQKGNQRLTPTRKKTQVKNLKQCTEQVSENDTS